MLDLSHDRAFPCVFDLPTLPGLILNHRIPLDHLLHGLRRLAAGNHARRFAAPAAFPLAIRTIRDFRRVEPAPKLFGTSATNFWSSSSKARRSSGSEPYHSSNVSQSKWMPFCFARRDDRTTALKRNGGNGRGVAARKTIREPMHRLQQTRLQSPNRIGTMIVPSWGT